VPTSHPATLGRHAHRRERLGLLLLGRGDPPGTFPTASILAGAREVHRCKGRAAPFTMSSVLWSLLLMLARAPALRRPSVLVPKEPTEVRPRAQRYDPLLAVCDTLGVAELGFSNPVWRFLNARRFC
jgi:hypothetical protein